jgi:hypothetical protein
MMVLKRLRVQKLSHRTKNEDKDVIMWIYDENR